MIGCRIYNLSYIRTHFLTAMVRQTGNKMPLFFLVILVVSHFSKYHLYLIEPSLLLAAFSTLLKV